MAWWYLPSGQRKRSPGLEKDNIARMLKWASCSLRIPSRRQMCSLWCNSQKGSIKNHYFAEKAHCCFFVLFAIICHKNAEMKTSSSSILSHQFQRDRTLELINTSGSRSMKMEYSKRKKKQQKTLERMLSTGLCSITKHSLPNPPPVIGCPSQIQYNKTHSHKIKT